MHFHHLHFYVENVTFWRRWFIDKMSFLPLREECALKSQATNNHTDPYESLIQGNVEIRLSGREGTAILGENPSEVGDYLRNHPSGLADVGFSSDRFDQVVNHAIAHGATLTKPIHRNQRGQRQCQFQGWADLRHTLVEITEPAHIDPTSLLQTIDHVVINVPKGELMAATDWYRQIFSLNYGQRFDINTASSGLCSQVLVHRDGSLQLPLNEPSSENSQIQEFLQHNRGAGVQHVALRSHHAVEAIARFKHQGLELIDVPDNYYEKLSLKADCPLRDLSAVSRQQLLVDWAEGGEQGMLLQTFTKPIFTEPTFFFEIIERGGYLKNGKPEVAQGFGEGNFQALFEAIERSQIERGSLKSAQETGDKPQRP